MTFQLAVITVLAAVALSSALAVILARDSRSAILALGIGAAALAGVFSALGAHFVAVSQLLIGLSVLLAFGLVGRTLAPAERAGLGPRDPGRVVIQSVGGVLALALGAVLVRVTAGGTAGSVEVPIGGPELADPGLALASRFVAPLPVLGLLLLAALLGAGALLRRGSR